MTDQTKEQATQPGTDIALLPPPERAALVLKSTDTEKTLRELVQKSADITTVSDSAGRELAHRSGMNLKNARVAIEKAGKAARDDANAFNTAVIAEQKRLIGITEKEEERIFGLRDNYDAKAKAEKEERERKERERVAAIRSKIDDIKGLPAASFQDAAEQLRATIGDLDAFEITEADFAELAGEAAAAKAEALGTLNSMLVRAEANEKEAARLAAEREELDRQRREQEERDRAAKEEREAEERRLAEERAALERERAELESAKAPALQPAEPAPADLFGADAGGAQVAITCAPDAAPEVCSLVDMGGDDQTVIATASRGDDGAVRLEGVRALHAMPPEYAAPTGYWCNGEYWGATPDGDGKAAEFIGQELKLVPFWTHGREVTFVVDDNGNGNAITTPATSDDAADLYRASLGGGQ